MKESKINSIRDITYKTALCIGFCQCIAMVPGTSRSAATIIGGMLLGLSRGTAAEFSFYLAIPVMAAASAYTLLKTGLSLSGHEWLLLIIGFVVSFFVALGVIAFFMNYIRKRDFKIFAYYRIILGIILIFLISQKLL
jgi:undecaprenyl-diphosphatase